MAAPAPAAKRTRRVGGAGGAAATPATTSGNKKPAAPPASATQGSAASATQGSTAGKGGKKSGITWTLNKLRLFLAVGAYAWAGLIRAYTSTDTILPFPPPPSKQ